MAREIEAKKLNFYWSVAHLYAARLSQTSRYFMSRFQSQAIEMRSRMSDSIVSRACPYCGASFTKTDSKPRTISLKKCRKLKVHPHFRKMRKWHSVLGRKCLECERLIGIPGVQLNPKQQRKKTSVNVETKTKKKKKRRSMLKEALDSVYKPDPNENQNVSLKDFLVSLSSNGGPCLNDSCVV
ncbi:uncharacterized protein [Oscarella lobularis]